MRFNLGEIDIVKNQAGQTNVFSLGLTTPQKKPGGTAGRAFTKQTRLTFTGIDVLNVSIGTARYIDLKDQRNNRTQKIDIQNCVLKGVKSPAIWAGWRRLSRCAAAISLARCRTEKIRVRASCNCSPPEISRHFCIFRARNLF